MMRHTLICFFIVLLPGGLCKSIITVLVGGEFIAYSVQRLWREERCEDTLEMCYLFCILLIWTSTMLEYLERSIYLSFWCEIGFFSYLFMDLCHGCLQGFLCGSYLQRLESCPLLSIFILFPLVRGWVDSFCPLCLYSLFSSKKTYSFV